MTKNQNIVSATKKIITLAIFVGIIQLAFLIGINVLLPSFLAGFEIESFVLRTIRIIVNIFLLFATFLSVAFLMRRAYKTYSLRMVKPIKCTVEDFFLFAYKRDTENKYKVYLLLKQEESGKFYLTYGDYSLSYYNYTYSKMNKTLLDIKMLRQDGSKVEIGDKVWMYMRRIVDVPIHLDTEKQTFKLKNRKWRFLHINEKYDLDIFANITFYEGAIDIEKSCYK